MNHGYLVEILGMAAAALTTLCWVPQATRILRTRDTRSISLVAQAAFAAGVALWFAYGLMIGSWPVILANSVTLVLALAILALKIRYK
jgi:MtN3 and saliva related transmembrane protein